MKHLSRRKLMLPVVTGIAGTFIALSARESRTAPSNAASLMLANEIRTVPPWRALPSRPRDAFDAIHSWVSTEEAAGNHAGVATQCFNLMATPAANHPVTAQFKHHVAFYLYSTNRFAYLDSLAPLFEDSSKTPPDLALIALLLASNARFSMGPAALSPAFRRVISNYAHEARACNPDVQTRVNNLLGSDQ